MQFLQFGNQLTFLRRHITAASIRLWKLELLLWLTHKPPPFRLLTNAPCLVQHLPSLYVLFAVSLSIWLGWAMNTVPFVVLGTYTAWFYLRYVQGKAGLNLRYDGPLSTFSSRFLSLPHWMCEIHRLSLWKTTPKGPEMDTAKLWIARLSIKLTHQTFKLYIKCTAAQLLSLTSVHTQDLGVVCRIATA